MKSHYFTYLSCYNSYSHIFIISACFFATVPLNLYQLGYMYTACPRNFSFNLSINFKSIFLCYLYSILYMLVDLSFSRINIPLQSSGLSYRLRCLNFRARSQLVAIAIIVCLTTPNSIQLMASLRDRNRCVSLHDFI